jgi:hypothetical protein
MLHQVSLPKSISSICILGIFSFSGFTRLSITKNTTDSLNIYILADYAIIRSYMKLEYLVNPDF